VRAKLDAASKLASLSAADNAISEIEQNFFDELLALTSVQLQTNALTSIPNSISYCKSLRVCILNLLAMRTKLQATS
jgi:Leucine-rich repeat (LRR) protein